MLIVADLGRTDYTEALGIQEKILKLRQADLIQDTLVLLEHPSVITIGRRGNPANILAPDELLSKEGICIHKVNRGGDVTYHGPGQIVGYPILDLNKRGINITTYVRDIEETLIQLLSEEYEITADRDPKHPGVWVGREKIAAVGFFVDHWVTTHGFAFNVNTNLNHFLWINPCGVKGRGVTSLQKILGYHLDLQEITLQVIAYFCKVFGEKPKMMNKQDFYRAVNGDEGCTS
ncbi:lipoyl(octanoyl) transferase LipB [bacterium]|nr:MAG: lipoyl(octanoyl) transferase LipB [bacterium]